MPKKLRMTDKILNVKIEHSSTVTCVPSMASMALRELNMAVFVFVLLFACTFVSHLLCSENFTGHGYELEFSSAQLPLGQSIVLKQGDTLNLTCKITSPSNDSLPRFKITVHTPYSSQNSMNRVLHSESHNIVNIVVQNLQESDSGEYMCQAINDDEVQTQLQQRVLVIVKNKKCGAQFFQCLTGRCIMKRYLCDGFLDCTGGEDESQGECGSNPCENKIYCDDHRCIPVDWCCDSFQDSNCTVKVLPSCCLQLSKSFMDHDQVYMNEPPLQGLNDMGFLQTTIYTIVGCAMAFMFIVTILVIAICRVHMKRSSLLTHCSGVRGGVIHARSRAVHHHHHGLQNVPLYDIDVLLNHTSYPAASVSPHSDSLITHNVINGIQFVGRPVDPPPYCEVVSSPPREGPPPPYTSLENLTRANPEARLVAHDSVDPCERDSLLGSTREVVALEDADLRGNAECLDTLAPSLLNAGRVCLSSQQPVQEVDRNCQVCSGAPLLVNSYMSDPNTISSSENGETVGELKMENGVDVNSCENLVVLQKVPDIAVTDKSSAEVSDVYDLDVSSPVRKICCTTQDENNVSLFCDSGADPLQCLHDTFIDISGRTGDFNPLVVVTASNMARVKGVDSAAPSVTLGNNGKTEVNETED